MVYKILFFFFCFLTLKTTAEKHTVYVSVCEVYNIKNRLVFSFRIFKNDLYDALKEATDGKEISVPVTNPIGCNIKWDGKPAQWMPAESCDLV